MQAAVRGKILQEECTSRAVALRSDCMLCFSQASANDSTAAGLTSAELCPPGPKRLLLKDKENGLNSTAKPHDCSFCAGQLR